MAPKTGTAYSKPQKFDPGKQTQIKVGNEYFYTNAPSTPGSTATGKNVTTTTLLGTPPPAGIPIPANIIKQFKLPAGSMITYTGLPRAGSGGTTITKATPTGGKALVEAIRESLPAGAAKALMQQWYGDPNFNPQSKDASKIYDTVYQSVTVNMAVHHNTDLLGSPELTGASAIAATIPGAKGSTTKASTVLNTPAGRVQAAQWAANNATQAKQFAISTAANAQQNAKQNALTQEGITAGITQATANQETSALGTISNYLQTWGLQADAPFVYQMIMKNGDHVTNIDAMLNAIRGNSTTGLGPAADAAMKRNYQSAFAGLEQYNHQPGAIHMTETQYQNYTSSIMNVSTQYGAPMPTQKEIGTLLNGHVSPVEFQQRVTDIYAQVSNADPAVKAALAQQYGVNQKDLFSYYANPKNALQTMQRQVAGAEIQDYGSRVGLNGLNAAGTNQLADMAKLAGTVGNSGLGYGVSQIEGSLLNASKDVALTHSAPGANPTTVNENQLIGSQLAGYQGTNQVASEIAVQRAETAKAAPFEKGGGYVQDAKGVVGVGSART